MKKIIISLIVLVGFSSGGYCQDRGVLISGGSYTRGARPSSDLSTEKEINPDIEAMIAQYVQQAVINTVLSKVGDIMQRAIKSQNLQVMPQVGYNAVQKAASQTFEQETMGDMAREAYEQSREYAIDQQQQGSSQSIIQSGIKSRIDEILDPINEDPVFRKIVEHYLKESVVQTQKMVMMNVAQRQAQMVAIQKQQAAMQIAMQKQYLQAVQQQAVQQEYMQQQMQQQAVQQQYMQQMQQQAVQQQYMQQMQQQGVY